MNPMYATNLGRHSDIGIMEESYPYCNGFAGFEATQSPEGSGEDISRGEMLRCLDIGSDGTVRGRRREATGEGYVIKMRYKGSPGSPFVWKLPKLQFWYTLCDVESECCLRSSY